MSRSHSGLEPKIPALWLTAILWLTYFSISTSIKMGDRQQKLTLKCFSKNIHTQKNSNKWLKWDFILLMDYSLSNCLSNINDYKWSCAIYFVQQVLFWRQEEKGTTEDEMVRWHHWLNGHKFEQAPRGGEGQGSLVCCCPWGHKELDTTEWLKNNNKAQMQSICT